MINMETHWTLGVVIGLPVLGLVVLALLVVTVLGFFADAAEMAVPALIVLLVVVGMALSPIGYYPYRAEYHQWRTVEGVVQEVGKRLIAEDKSMSERYVLKINGQPYGVDDTRASLVKIGDHVRLSCRRDWQYASVPGYVCRWDS